MTAPTVLWIYRTEKRIITPIRQLLRCIHNNKGHNGVGKSTLAKTLCGLIKPLAGTIRWNGKNASKSELLSHSFMVMQDVNYQLFSDSVREEVLLGAKFPEACDEVLDALVLTEFAEQHPMSLSGGQKQRVAITSAMLSGKEFIVLDDELAAGWCDRVIYLEDQHGI